MSTIPAGTYAVRGVKGSEQYGESKSNTPQIGINLEIIGGEHEGTQITTILYFTEASAPYAIARLRSLGWQGDNLENLDGINENEALARVSYETYEGKERMKVDIMTGGGTFTFNKPLNPQQKRAFAAQFKPLAQQGTGLAKVSATDDFPSSYNKRAGTPGPRF